jgi:hypothetical protein
MKKLLLLVIFSFSFYCKAQTSVYHPFPEDSAKWCAYNCSLDWSGYFNGSTYQLSGKILINGNWYSRMLRHEENCEPPSSFCVCGQLNNEHIDTLYIRQDTILKKVWQYFPPNIDSIFFDFDLNVGDTIDASKAAWARNGPVAIVSSIDSILIDGQYRRQFKYHLVSDSNCNDNALIEGIGPNHGFFILPNNCFEYEAALIYFEQNNSILIGNTNFEYYYCHDFTTNIIESFQFSFSISPNPAHDKLNVECNLPNAELKIYDMTGRMVQEEKLHSRLSTVNCQLSSGVYFVKVSNGKKEAVQKLVVE